MHSWTSAPPAGSRSPESQMITKLLIANRGEIAVRVIRACREIGISTVAVYSEADQQALHVQLADDDICIGPAPSAESYLNIPAVISAARVSGADAIHPGYGFLSQNAAFAAACEGAGVIFVGPSPSSIARMGSKVEARKLMVDSGVPVVPGDVPEDQSDGGLRRSVERVGLPALVKASAGGGGKGMRRDRPCSRDRRGHSSRASRGDGRLRRRNTVRRAPDRARPPRRGSGLRRWQRNRRPFVRA